VPKQNNNNLCVQRVLQVRHNNLQAATAAKSASKVTVNQAQMPMQSNASPHSTAALKQPLSSTNTTGPA
jgi:hypothetical protein